MTCKERSHDGVLRDVQRSKGGRISPHDLIARPGVAVELIHHDLRFPLRKVEELVLPSAW